MQYGVLPGGGSPKRPKKSPGRLVASHLYNQVRRPSRFRGRLLFTIFGLTGILCLVYGRQHTVDLSRTASAIKEYIPDSITDVLAQYGDFEEQRWDDGVDPENTTQMIIKKPKFHLLIPANKPTENLCKTLMSAAILNYPPPTLISYGNKGHDERPGADIVSNIFNFLHGKEAHDDDLILIVEEDAWFQLPAEVTINRFFHGLRDSNDKLLDKYGEVKYNDSSARTSEQNQKYSTKVLFGSTKECSNGISDPACYSIPESPLPKDIYGDETDRHPEGKYNRPRYMSSSMAMGRVADLRPIYKEAIEMLEFEDIGKRGSQYIFSQIFGEQEYARTLSLASAGNGPSKWRSWLMAVLSKPHNPSVNPPNITLNAEKQYEFGIGLDHFSWIFQVMNNSAEDVRFVRFNHPSVIASPSRISAKAFKNPIRLSSDLSLAPPPFFQNQISAANPDPPLTELDNMHDDTALWTDIELSTNVIVPGSSVPASLNFHGSEYLLDGVMWEKMWFHPNARALMRQYIRSPDGPLAASAAAEGGDKWWDLRGGKGGFWTDRGEWLEWNEVCGAFDDKVFGDGKGEFMREKEEVGGQKAVYKFGQLVQGKPPKTKPGNLDKHKGLLGEAMKSGGEPQAGDTVQGEVITINPGTGEIQNSLLGEAVETQIKSQLDEIQASQEALNSHKAVLGDASKAGEGTKAGKLMAVGEAMPIGHEMQAAQGMNSAQGTNNVQVMDVGAGMQIGGTMNLAEATKPEDSTNEAFDSGASSGGHKPDVVVAGGKDNTADGSDLEDEKKAEEILKNLDEKESNDSKLGEKEQGKDSREGNEGVKSTEEKKG
ncbi:uncharacterized protein PAC_08034 [Phialocephala subalpina]|uniref:Uncharacterized protein n=1 Tax=Phialocephala subalpina TaxID=576137 RepID=A0A1L7WZE8_9HELO|nr:uncharacterized protein PAC_08034 [Phialocephala subalpina]